MENMKSLFKNANYMMSVANQYLEANQFIEAISILEKVVDLYPDYGPAYNSLGWISAHIFHQTKEAEQYYDKAVELSPEYPITYVNLAVLLNQIEKADKLLALSKEALKIPGIHKPKLNRQLGVMYEKQNDLNKAIKSYQEAVQYSVENEEVEDLIFDIQRCRLKLERV